MFRRRERNHHFINAMGCDHPWQVTHRTEALKSPEVRPLSARDVVTEASKVVSQTRPAGDLLHHHLAEVSRADDQDAAYADAGAPPAGNDPA